ncbi:unnamed protein product, partial [Rotaria magnacalcarata]
SILKDGKILVIGGSDGSATLNSAELYDPLTGTLTTIDNMSNARNSHTAFISTRL